METESTEGSRWRSVDVEPCSEGQGSTSEPFPSSDGGPRSALATATTAAAAATSAAEATAAVNTAKAGALSPQAPAPYSELTEPSSDLSLLGEPRGGPSFTHKIGHGSLGFEPTYVSCITGDPCTAAALNSIPSLVPGSSSGPVPGSSSGAGRGSGPGQGSVPGSGSGPSPACGPGPGTSPGPELSPCTPSRFGNLTADLIPDYTCWNHHCHWEPQKQPPCEFLQVSEPGARGLWKPSEAKGKPKVFCEMLPRGQCLLHNWEEERATNHLDQVPSMQDGSESYFFRHGHQGLLTMQLQSPMPSSTTQKDSYRLPGNPYRPLRGKREAMLEMLLHHQICKEVQAEQEPTKKLFEVESVTHHDYRRELVQEGPPAPTKPHDYRWEQPETFWIQRAPQLPGVSNIRTLDTPFRKNCSFSTPVPLSLGQPLPYEPENYLYQLGEISSLACQGRGQGGGAGRTTPV
ncbi:PREDICTED: sperm-associated antigen 8 [Propithecus coquereli]|uniref:Sperm associated antigen 8 n=1 Tax=Propithecus coquereli TaxID=379532 RepID=A0A2K6GTT4_PROCO|nr:PREDICTED: sperm-associated antigen 8 [Propithecus coquereli]